MKKFFLNKKIKAFTLIELIVVIAIIGILASVIYPSFVNYQKRSRDARRQVDIKTIVDALERYQIEFGGVPVTYSYSGADAGGWDYSSQGDFLSFFKNKNILNKVPVDPINNQTHGESNWVDSVPLGGGYYYKYYCYNSPQQVIISYIKEINDDKTLNISKSQTAIPYKQFTKCLTTVP